MFHLYVLPVHLVGELFESWLDMRSLLALDNASCSAGSRQLYLEVMGSGEFCFRAPYALNLRTKGMQWFVTRRAQVDRVWVDGSSKNIHLGLMTAFLHITGASLKSFSIVNEKFKDQLTAVLGLLSFSAPHLEVLRIYAYSAVEVDVVALGSLLSACAQSMKRLEVGPLGTLQSSPLQNLHMLDLSYSKADSDTLCHIVSASPSLRSFHCDNLRGSNACLDALAEHCPLLQVLAYEKGDRSDVSSLVRLLQCCPDLEAVDITTEDASGSRSTTTAQITAIMQHCRKLRVFAAGTYDDESKGLSNAVGRAVASRVQDLVHLQLLGCAFTTDAPLAALARNCSNLKSLEILWIAENLFEPGMALVKLVSNLHSITHLRFSDFGVWDEVLVAIAAHSPLLESLALVRCAAYTEGGITSLVCGCAALQRIRTGESDEEHDIFTPEAMLHWQGLRPGLQFSRCDDDHTLWDSLGDIGREKIVFW